MAQKVSEYLKTELDSHSIFSHDMVATEFKERTGMEPCWPFHTQWEVKRAIEEKGLGGSLTTDAAEKLAYGYEIAESLATKLANYDCGHINGRGSRFRLAIETLEKAGY